MHTEILPLLHQLVRELLYIFRKVYTVEWDQENMGWGNASIVPAYVRQQYRSFRYLCTASVKAFSHSSAGPLGGV